MDTYKLFDMATKTLTKVNNTGKLTGKELGQLLIASYVNDNTNKNNSDYEPLLDQDDFNFMEAQLTTEERYVYGVYLSVYNFIKESNEKNAQLTQQFLHGINKYANYLMNCTRAENRQARWIYAPLIVSENQKGKLFRRIRKEYKLKTESFASLVYNCLHEDDEIKEFIEPILLHYNDTAFTNTTILKQWIRKYGSGYYTLPNNLRSDKVPVEQWNKELEAQYKELHNIKRGTLFKALETVEIEKRERLHEFIYKGVEEVKKSYKERYNKELDTKTAEEVISIYEEQGLVLLSNELFLIHSIYEREAPRVNINSKKTAYKIASELISSVRDFSPKWTFYNIQEEVSKADILAQIDEFYNFNDIKSFRMFIQDFNDLFKAVRNYIFTLLPSAAQLEEALYCEKSFTYEELARAGFNYYKKMLSKKQYSFNEMAEYWNGTEEEKKRIETSGLAVLQYSENDDVYPNSAGFIKDYLGRLKAEYGDSLDELAESQRIQADIKNIKELLFIPALTNINYTNSWFDILSDIYDIEFIKELKLNTDIYKNQIAAINNLTYELYSIIGGSIDEKQKKRNFIKQFFAPIELNNLEPEEELLSDMKTRLLTAGYSIAAMDIFENQKKLFYKSNEKGNNE